MEPISITPHCSLLYWHSLLHSTSHDFTNKMSGAKRKSYELLSSEILQLPKILGTKARGREYGINEEKNSPFAQPWLSPPLRTGLAFFSYHAGRDECFIKSVTLGATYTPAFIDFLKDAKNFGGGGGRKGEL